MTHSSFYRRSDDRKEASRNYWCIWLIQAFTENLVRGRKHWEITDAIEELICFIKTIFIISQPLTMLIFEKFS